MSDKLEPKEEKKMELPETNVVQPDKPSIHKSSGYTSSNRNYDWEWIYASDFDEYAKEVAEYIQEREHQLLSALATIQQITGERDRQYEFNTGQIVKVAELEATIKQKDERIAELENANINLKEGRK